MVKESKNHLRIMEARFHKKMHLEAAIGFSEVCLSPYGPGRGNYFISSKTIWSKFIWSKNICILHFIQTSQVFVQKINVFFGSTHFLKIIWSKNQILFLSKKVSKENVNQKISLCRTAVYVLRCTVLCECRPYMEILYDEVWWLLWRR